MRRLCFGGRVGDEAIKARISVQGIETGIYAQICNPARSFLHRTRKPSERLIVVAQGCMDDAELVREQALVAAQPLEILSDLQRLTPILKNGERVTETREHHGAA